MSMPNFSFEGQVAIITGGGTGIGRAIALEFAKAGADVVVASRRLSVLEKVSEEVKTLGRRSLAIQTDISRKTDVDNLVQRVMDEFGAIDILVNNAGILINASLLEHGEEDWDKVIDINLKGYFLCSQAVSKEMVERKKGNIVNIVSTAAFKGGSPYSISKAGEVSLTRGLARELASYNIRVNAIAIGWVRTEMTESVWNNPKAHKAVTARIPMGRWAEPSEIASVALFLASDASSHITGGTIVTDGGMEA